MSVIVEKYMPLKKILETKKKKKSPQNSPLKYDDYIHFGYFIFKPSNVCFLLI